MHNEYHITAIICNCSDTQLQSLTLMALCSEIPQLHKGLLVVFFCSLFVSHWKKQHNTVRASCFPSSDPFSVFAANVLTIRFTEQFLHIEGIPDELKLPEISPQATELASTSRKPWLFSTSWELQATPR